MSVSSAPKPGSSAEDDERTGSAPAGTVSVSEIAGIPLLSETSSIIESSSINESSSTNEALSINETSSINESSSIKEASSVVRLELSVSPGMEFSSVGIRVWLALPGKMLSSGSPESAVSPGTVFSSSGPEAPSASPGSGTPPSSPDSSPFSGRDPCVRAIHF